MTDWPIEPTEPDRATESRGSENPSPPAELGRARAASGGEDSGGGAAGVLSSGGGSSTGASWAVSDAEEALARIDAPARRARARRRRVRADEERRPRLSARQRLLLLDTWSRSGLSATNFSSMVGISATTLYKWKRRFDEEGPAALENAPRIHDLWGAD